MKKKDRFVTRLLNSQYKSLGNTTYAISDQPKVKTWEVRYESISDFWRGALNQGYQPGTRIAIEGQLSIFGPALPGVPIGKRKLHLNTRRILLQIEQTLRNGGYRLGPDTLNALLGYTAGQMVIRPPLDVPYIYLGLYQSIVRNAIPLFVKREYYEKVVSQFFARETTAEVLVVGYPMRIDEFGKNFEVFLKEFGIYDIYEPKWFDQVFSGYILQVDGDDDLSRIEYRSKSRYLDGDIWVAIRTADIDRVVCRFLDISDVQDLANERSQLQADINKLYGEYQIISEYDQMNRLMTGRQIINVKRKMQASQAIRIGAIKSKDGIKITPDYSRGVFLSYSHSDKDAANRLKNALEQNDINVSIDYESMQASENISDFILRSIQGTDITLSIISNRSLLSAWVAMETTLTYYNEMFLNKKKFIACYIDDDFFQTDFRLKATKQIDLKISEIDKQIPEYIEAKIDTIDLNNEKTRLFKLRNNLGDILSRLKESLTLDIREKSFEESVTRIIKTIKGN